MKLFTQGRYFYKFYLHAKQKAKNEKCLSFLETSLAIQADPREVAAMFDKFTVFPALSYVSHSFLCRLSLRAAAAINSAIQGLSGKLQPASAGEKHYIKNIKQKGRNELFYYGKWVKCYPSFYSCERYNGTFNLQVLPCDAG